MAKTERLVRTVVRVREITQRMRKLFVGIAAVAIIGGGCVSVPPRADQRGAAPVQETQRPIVFKNTYASPQPFLEGIYNADHRSEPSVGGRIRAMIVPHHLVAAEDIAVGIRTILHQNVSRIILISPDHFHHCPTDICTVDATFQTLFGDVQTDPRIVAELASSSLVTLNADLFRQEHGIYAILPFIAHYLPDVTVTPVVLSQDRPWKADRQAISDLLDRIVDDRTVVIVSSDFSHYLPLAESEQEDADTKEALLSADLDRISSLKQPDQTDCAGCLWAVSACTKKRGISAPRFLMHTNSAILLHDPNAPSTTSHYTIVWTSAKPVEE